MSWYFTFGAILAIAYYAYYWAVEREKIKAARAVQTASSRYVTSTVPGPPDGPRLGLAAAVFLAWPIIGLFALFVALIRRFAPKSVEG